MSKPAIAAALFAALPFFSMPAFAQSSAPASPAASGATAAAPPTRAPIKGAIYVALGASFSAGPGLPMQKRGVPARCGQSALNFPALLAIRFGVSLHDASCSGATTENVLRGWNELPPQIDSITPQTRLVTISAGGNDLGYVGGLFGATNCETKVQSDIAAGKPVTQCPPARKYTEAEFQKVEKNLREIASRINARAPQAKIVFVTYLSMVPSTLCRATPIAPARAESSRLLADRIAQLTAKVARETGSLVARMDEISRDHTPCDLQPWTNGAAPGYNGADGIQWHPNIAGMQATATEIAAILMRPGGALPPEIKPKTETAPKAETVRPAPPSSRNDAKPKGNRQV